jgi:outer membrane protein assembly factor BamB
VGLPSEWDAEKNIVWKTALPGPGASSPVTFGDKVFITCYTGYGVDASNPGDLQDLKRHLICLGRKDGKVLWNVEQPSADKEHAYEGFNALHGYASGTPAVDDQAVYVFFGTAGVVAYSHGGKQLWLTNCGGGTHDWGSGTSPVVFQDLVIVNAGVESGSLIALNKKTGTEVWRQPGMVMSWSTPALVRTAEGKWELVVSVKGKVLGFDPATGATLWSCDGIQDYICPTILVQDGVLYAIGARASSSRAIRAGGRGDVTGTHKLWEAKKGSNVSSPVYHQGHLYWAHESRGAVYCADAKTGEVLYEERLKPQAGRVYASPVVADGKIYYVSRDQGAFVVAAKPEFELLAHNVIATDTSIFNGSPAISNGQILLRSDKFLYCIGQ